MILLHAVAFLLGVQVVLGGDNLRGPKENQDSEAIVQKSDGVVDHDEGRRVLKLTAQEKRQQQRDERRRRENPNRTQEEEDRERERKKKQAQRRDRPEADPYYNDDFREIRERDRQEHCDRDRRGCNFIADEETYDRQYRRDRGREDEHDRCSDDCWEDYNYGYLTRREWNDCNEDCDKDDYRRDRGREDEYDRCIDYCWKRYDDGFLTWEEWRDCNEDCDKDDDDDSDLEECYDDCDDDWDDWVIRTLREYADCYDDCDYWYD